MYYEPSDEADGKHDSVDELEPGIAPGKSDCDANTTCPAPMYWVDGEYAGVYSNIPSLLPRNASEDLVWTL